MEQVGGRGDCRGPPSRAALRAFKLGTGTVRKVKAKMFSGLIPSASWFGRLASRLRPPSAQGGACARCGVAGLEGLRQLLAVYVEWIVFAPDVFPALEPVVMTRRGGSPPSRQSACATTSCRSQPSNSKDLSTASSV